MGATRVGWRTISINLTSGMCSAKHHGNDWIWSHSNLWSGKCKWFSFIQLHRERNSETLGRQFMQSLFLLLLVRMWHCFRASGREALIEDNSRWRYVMCKQVELDLCHAYIEAHWGRFILLPFSSAWIQFTTSFDGFQLTGRELNVKLMFYFVRSELN